MKLWAKGGLIGFIVVFIGLWILLLATGHDSGGWKCTTINGGEYCSFLHFVFSPIHIAFVLFFSWVGFLGGVIDANLINKMVRERGNDRKNPLRATQAILITFVIAFAVVGVLAFENWVAIMVYAIIFVLFILAVTWYIEKKKFS